MRAVVTIELEKPIRFEYDDGPNATKIIVIDMIIDKIALTDVLKALGYKRVDQESIRGIKKQLKINAHNEMSMLKSDGNNIANVNVVFYNVPQLEIAYGIG